MNRNPDCESGPGAFFAENRFSNKEKTEETSSLHLDKSKRLSGLDGSQCNILPCPIPQLLQDKGGQGTIGSLRRFFGDFLSLVKESYSSKTGQAISIAEVT